MFEHLKEVDEQIKLKLLEWAAAGKQAKQK
jgi:hypothetical protein